MLKLFVCFSSLLLPSFAVREERRGVKDNKHVLLYSHYSLSTIFSSTCLPCKISKSKERWGIKIPHQTLEQKQQSQQETKHG
jgi:hypothetical protein